MMCKECDTDLFKINVKDCEDCECNGAHTEHDGYIHDAERIEKEGLERDQTYTEGECAMGSCWDSGCYMFECHNCGAKTNLAMMVE